VVFDSGVAAWKISDRTMMFEQNCRTYYDLEGTFRFTAPVNHVRNTVAIMVYPLRTLLEVDCVTGEELGRYDVEKVPFISLLATPVHNVILL
jgi:hypothetical protein